MVIVGSDIKIVLVISRGYWMENLFLRKVIFIGSVNMLWVVVMIIGYMNLFQEF